MGKPIRMGLKQLQMAVDSLPPEYREPQTQSIALASGVVRGFLGLPWFKRHVEKRTNPLGFFTIDECVQKNSESDFSLQVYLSVLALVFLGVGSVVYGAIQPTRLANPGVAAYQAPAAVLALYPQQRTSFFEGDIVPAPVAELEASALEHALPTTVRPTTRSERKVGSKLPITARVQSAQPRARVNAKLS